jgi:hypothetical protein
MKLNENTALIKQNLIEEMARIIYADSYTQYGTCTADHWKKTSETQRNFCRGQAEAVLNFLIQKSLVKTLIN